MSKQILIYEKLNDVKTLEKGRGEDGFMRLKGVFGECSKQKNRNGRIYVAENYKQMVDRIKQRITAEGVPGQLEHPNTMNIDYNEVSHVIEDINIDENGLVTGTVKLLNTPKGKIAQALVEGGLPLFISSRATGNVDKNGVVTLENIQTYDLVGTPGFANARLNLAESFTKESGSEFVTESFDDNLFIVESKEEPAAAAASKENEFNMTEQEHKELLDKIDLLEKAVNKTNKRVDEVNSPAYMEALASGIQNWIVNEYSPSLQDWIVKDAVTSISEEARESILKQVAEGTQQWMLKEFAPHVQNWLTEHFASENNEKLVKELSEGIQGWCTEHFSAEIKKWVAEDYTQQVDKWISETFQGEMMSKIEEKLKSLNESREQKLASIDNILEMLDKNPAKPVVDRVNEHNTNPDEPLYLREMPASVRPLWESADTNKKEYIQRKARLFQLNTSEAVTRFWESIDWQKQAPAVQVYEGLESVTDPYERDLRMRLRKHAQA